MSFIYLLTFQDFEEVKEDPYNYLHYVTSDVIKHILKPMVFPPPTKKALRFIRKLYKKQAKLMRYEKKVSIK